MLEAGEKSDVQMRWKVALLHDVDCKSGCFKWLAVGTKGGIKVLRFCKANRKFPKLIQFSLFRLAAICCDISCLNLGWQKEPEKGRVEDVRLCILFHLFHIIKGSLEDTSELRRVEKRCDCGKVK